ncbi:hypothetical protein [Sphingobacterium wenxiniae]|uniref:MORN repeat variant n=1 Tax=Sphingobacterium wenxiniae TaxID=683125 RepID=A0A1I6NQH2_9SPHI|nr:hypothetical protein [Sphingobacterium wenxiniae]SFS30157.1 hypothetical protein SAMN05660206_1012 [Sphingobacterium wenxiniae]
MKKWVFLFLFVPFYLHIMAQDTLYTYHDDGRIAEKKVMSRFEPETVQLLERYVDDQLQSVVYYDFTIADNPQDSYEGIYQGGAPFSGYFKLYRLIDDIQLIDYYEEGQLKYRYSFELLEQLEGYMHYIYDKETTYKDGRIVNGPDYKLVGRERLNTFYYEEGEINAFDVNLFAMHYFNRLTFTKSDGQLIVTEMQSPVQLHISEPNGILKIDVFEEDNLIASLTVPVNFDKDSELNAYHELENRGDVMTSIFFMCLFLEPDSLDQLFQKLMVHFQQENMEDVMVYE